MKSVLISIQPYWVFLIIARTMGWNIPQEKTIEVRKDFPKDGAWNKRVHIYCSKNRKSFNRIPKQHQPFMEKLLGKVIGEFVCDRVDINYPILIPNTDIALYNDEWVLGSKLADACLTLKEIAEYGKGKPVYGWHISDLKIYDNPKELGEFEYSSDKNLCNKNDCDNCGCSYFKVKIGNTSTYGCKKFIIAKPPKSWCYIEE